MMIDPGLLCQCFDPLDLEGFPALQAILGWQPKQIHVEHMCLRFYSGRSSC